MSLESNLADALKSAIDYINGLPPGVTSTAEKPDVDWANGLIDEVSSRERAVRNTPAMPMGSRAGRYAIGDDD